MSFPLCVSNLAIYVMIIFKGVERLDKYLKQLKKVGEGQMQLCVCASGQFFI